MDALELLKEDHKKVADLFEKLEDKENEKQKLQVFAQIKTELTVHTHIEETILYPACKEHEETKDMTMEALEEHKQIKTLLREIPELSEGSEKLDAKLKVLKENVEHHVDEEEDEFFPKIRKVFSDEQLEQMGIAMQGEKKNAK